MIVGYASGVFDLFHVGHLNILTKAKEQCDYLIAGVASDDLTVGLKGRSAIISEQERLRIVSALRVVDKAVIVNTSDCIKDMTMLGASVLLKGTDCTQKSSDLGLKKKIYELGFRVVFIDYTEGISSTIIKERLNES